MTLYFLKIFLALVLTGAYSTARAEMYFGLQEGYSIGTLTREIDEKFTTLTTIGSIGYRFRHVNVHGFFQSMDLSYNSGDSTYKGVYALSGLGVGGNIYYTRRGVYYIAVQKPFSGTYAVLSETSATIKDTTYQHSELTSLQDGNALQIQAGYDFLLLGRGSNRKGENIYIGGKIGYLRQEFATQSSRIKTNNSELAPVSISTRAVNYSVTVYSLYLTVDYDI